MKKSGLFLQVAFLVLYVVGCSGIRDAKDAHDMEKEGNEIIRQLDESNSVLLNLYGIVLSPTDPKTDVQSQADAYPWGNRSKEQINQIREVLTSQASRARRLMEIAQHKSMRLYGEPTNITQTQTNAHLYLKSLAHFESQNVQNSKAN